MGQVVAVHRRAFSASALRYSIYASDRIQAFLADSIKTSASVYKGVCRDSQLIGYTHVRLLEGVPHLNNVAVDVGLQAKGVGSELLRDVVGTARSAGHEKLTLDVSVEDERLVAWYARLGFVPTGVAHHSLLVREALASEAPTYRVSMTKAQREKYRRYHLSGSEFEINGSSHSVGMLGRALFRVVGSPGRDLAAAAAREAPSRELLCVVPVGTKPDFETEVVGVTQRMELNL